MALSSPSPRAIWLALSENYFSSDQAIDTSTSLQGEDGDILNGGSTSFYIYGAAQITTVVGTVDILGHKLEGNNNHVINTVTNNILKLKRQDDDYDDNEYTLDNRQNESNKSSSVMIYSPPYEGALRISARDTIDLRLLASSSSSSFNLDINNNEKEERKRDYQFQEENRQIRAKKAGSALHVGLVSIQQQQQHSNSSGTLLQSGYGSISSPTSAYRHSGAFFQRAVVCIEPIEAFSKCLSEYDLVGGISLAPIEPAFSVALPGVCILRSNPDIYATSLLSSKNEISTRQPSQTIQPIINHQTIDPHSRVHCAVVIEDEDGNFKFIDSSLTTTATSLTTTATSTTSTISTNGTSTNLSLLLQPITNTNATDTLIPSSTISETGTSRMRSALRAVGACRAWQQAINRICSRERQQPIEIVLPSTTSRILQMSNIASIRGGRGGGGGRGGRGRGGTLNKKQKEEFHTTSFQSQQFMNTTFGRSLSSSSLAVPLSEIIPIVLVCGPKGSGKSTFLRVLTNSLLSSSREVDKDSNANEERDDYDEDEDDEEEGERKDRKCVAYLDLDPGQPEHAPPGIVGLFKVYNPILSPPYTRTHHSIGVKINEISTSLVEKNEEEEEEKEEEEKEEKEEDDNKKYQRRDQGKEQDDEKYKKRLHISSLFQCASPYSMRFLGATSCKDDPAGFIRASISLIEIYRKEFAEKKIPLVVNMHGWMHGLGFETLQSIVSYLQPSHLIRLGDTVGGGLLLSETQDDGGEGGGSGGGGGGGGSGSGSDERLITPHCVWQPKAPFGFTRGILQCEVTTVQPWHLKNNKVATTTSVSTTSSSSSSLPPPPRAARSPVDLRASRIMTYLLSRLTYTNSKLLYEQSQSKEDASKDISKKRADSSSARDESIQRAESHARDVSDRFFKNLEMICKSTFTSVLSDQRIARTSVRGIESPAFHLAKALAYKVPLADIQMVASPYELVSKTTKEVEEEEGKGEEERNRSRLIAHAGVYQLVGLCCSNVKKKEEEKEKKSSTVSTPSFFDTTLFTETIQIALNSSSIDMDNSSVFASDLVCLGLGFLRSFERGDDTDKEKNPSKDDDNDDSNEEEIHIVSPLLLSDMMKVDTIVLWSSTGGGEIPCQLLYRGAPEGDPYCFSSQLVLGGGGGSGGSGLSGGGSGLGVANKGGSGQGRTGLKRRRLG